MDNWQEFIKQLEEAEESLNHPERWPKTLEEAVDSIILGMSEEDKQKIKSISEEDLLGEFHFGWGTGIRNAFGLWAGNQELLDSCGVDHPDDASGVIIRATWSKLRQI